MMHDLTRGEVRSATIVCRDVGTIEESGGSSLVMIIQAPKDDETDSDKVGEESFHISNRF